MNAPSYLEDHISQIPAIQLLINMGYEYITPTRAMELRGGRTSVVLFEDILRQQLQKINTIQRKGSEYKFSNNNLSNAIQAIKDLPMQDGYINANKALHELLTLGKSFEQTIDGDKKSHTLQYIDWKNPKNNVFHVTEEYSVLRTARADTYRPDVLLFINGIPTVIIECKTSALKGNKTPTELAIEQQLRNQEKDGIRDLYVYSNLLLSLASNDGRYGTTGTPKQFWSKWKELFPRSTSEAKYYNTLTALKNQPLTDANKAALFSDRFRYVKTYFDHLETEERPVTEQDKLLFSLCDKKRLLDLIYNFSLYDDGIKKVARYQQYFAVNDTLRRVTKFDKTGRRKGGVIWHTQGSGKSLTMVMLASMLAAHPEISNPKLILVTDRIDLDDQISQTFRKCKKEVRQANTGSELTKYLADNSDAITTTVINKFEKAVKQTKQPYTSADIFVLIDEGHRTQYGTFSVNMQKIFPNACFIAFTGTPLMKKQRSTAEKFGGYIGIPYTVGDAVADGAVVPLLYEGRHNHIQVNEVAINTFFDKLAVREDLTDYGKAQLKKKVNTVNELNKVDHIIYARAVDISEHYVDFHQTHNDLYKPKAQLVVPTIQSALLYHEYLKEINLVTSEVIVTRSDTREGTEDAYYQANEIEAREEKYFSGLQDKYGDLKDAEKNIINQFKKKEHPEILIVVAKLLTGFDAPNNTVLYLCKSLKEHTLLQAIARVNRVHPGKDYGFIIDYYGNLENLNDALQTYSGLSDKEEAHAQDMLTDISTEIEKLPNAHSDLWDLFQAIKDKHVEPTVYEEHLQPEDIRHKFYEKVSVFARLLKLALSSYEYVTATPEAQLNKYKKDAKFFLKLRVDVKRRYNDDISYQEFEPQVRKLFNRHVTSGEIMSLNKEMNIFNQEQREEALEQITGKAAKADHISSRTIKAINVKMQEDPVYYKKLADLIKETIEAYHQKRIDETEYLRQAKGFENEFINGVRDDAPEALQGNEAGLAFYNFSKTTFLDPELLKTQFHVEMGLLTDRVVLEKIYIHDQKVIDWQNNSDLVGKINIALGDEVYDLLKKYDLDTDWKKIDTVIEECLKVAKLKY